MFGKQKQSGGDGSQNVQAQVVHIHTGVTEADVARISTELVQKNLEEYHQGAQELIEQRVAEMSSEVAAALASADTLDSMTDPGMQYAVLSAQREYARTGDEELAENLLRLVTERSRETGRTTRQLVLDESLQVAGQLCSP